MSPPNRSSALAALVLTLLLLTGAPGVARAAGSNTAGRHAAAKHTAGPRPGGSGCGSQAAAVNEYCESVPGAGGPGGTPSGGAAGLPGGASARLAGSLPTRLRQAALRSKAGPRAGGALLSLPAPFRPTSLNRGGTNGAGTGSLLEPFLLVLVIVALVLGGAGVAIRRRGSAGPAAAGP